MLVLATATLPSDRRTPNYHGPRTLMLQTYKSPSVQVEEGGSTHEIPYSAEPSLGELFAIGHWIYSSAIPRHSVGRAADDRTCRRLSFHDAAAVYC